METCGFNEAWVGICKNESSCKQHSDLKCSVCEEKADHSCSNTSGLVCGTPLCSSKTCIVTHNLTAHTTTKNNEMFLEAVFFEFEYRAVEDDERNTYFKAYAERFIKSVKEIDDRFPKYKYAEKCADHISFIKRMMETDLSELDITKAKEKLKEYYAS